MSRFGIARSHFPPGSSRFVNASSCIEFETRRSEIATENSDSATEQDGPAARQFVALYFCFLLLMLHSIMRTTTFNISNDV